MREIHEPLEAVQVNIASVMHRVEVFASAGKLVKGHPCLALVYQSVLRHTIQKSASSSAAVAVAVFRVRGIALNPEFQASFLLRIVITVISM